MSEAMPALLAAKAALAELDKGDITEIRLAKQTIDVVFYCMSLDK